MIISALLNLIYRLLDLLLIFQIPDLPQDALNYVNQFFDYLVTGASILANYTPLEYLFVLFGLLLIVDVAIMVYHFVMWIIRKIPFTGIT